MVRQIIAEEPSVSDREIGRRLGCHHSFANRVRREMRQHDDAGTSTTSKTPPAPRSVAERTEEAVADEGPTLEEAIARLRDEVDALRWRSVEVTRDATDLWALCGQLQGEVYMLRREAA